MQKKPAVEYSEVDGESHGMRLDNYLLSRIKKVPRSLIYRVIRSGEVRVNSKRKNAMYRVEKGDKVRIPPIDFEPPKPVELELDSAFLADHILFEDEAIMVLNKPRNLAVHAGSGLSYGIIDMLKEHFKAPNLELVHRLDRETTGCLLIAKKKSVLRLMHQQMREHAIAKTYHVLVDGIWPKQIHEVDMPLSSNQKGPGGVKIIKVDHKAGKEARTTFNRIAAYKDASLLSAHLHTGRTHQIRVHAQFKGHAIIGDSKYMSNNRLDFFKGQYGIKNLLLHAQKLVFMHPISKEKLMVEAPYDALFAKAQQDLEKAK